MLHNANIHVDKIKVIGPCSHVPLTEDLFFKVDMETGELMAISAAARQHTFFSHGGEIHVKFMSLRRDGTATRMRLDFCPPLLFQRHNLFGHSSIADYLNRALALVVKKLGLSLTLEDEREWREGRVKLTEVHLTGNFGVPAPHVKPIIAAIARSVGPGMRWDSDTSISYGFTERRRSKYHALTIYYKQDQLKTLFGRAPDPIQLLLIDEAKNAIRAEIKLYSQRLLRSKLNTVSDWSNGKVQEVFFETLATYKLQRAIQPQLTDDELNCLTPREAQVYQLWMAEVPVTSQFRSRTTAHKYVRAIYAKVGVDISGHYHLPALPMICLSDVFSYKNVLPVPSWAIGTEFYLAPENTSLYRRGCARGIADAPILETERLEVHHWKRKHARGIGNVPIDPNCLEQE